MREDNFFEGGFWWGFCRIRVNFVVFSVVIVSFWVVQRGELCGGLG